MAVKIDAVITKLIILPNAVNDRICTWLEVYLAYHADAVATTVNPTPISSEP